MIFVFRRNKFLLHKPKRATSAYRLILCRLYTPLACYAITHNQRNCKQFQIQWELEHCTAKIDADRLCLAFAQQKC